MERLWAHDASATCLHPGWPLCAGWAEVRESWATIFANTASMRFEIADERVDVRRTMAWVVCVERIRSTGPAGDAMVGAVIATNVFRGDGDAWKMVHHHGSAHVARRTQPPPATPPRVAACSIDRSARAQAATARGHPHRRDAGKWLDDRFLDPLLGFALPGVGDVVGSALGLYVVVVAFRRKLPLVTVARMLLNLGIDALVGAVPLAGDLFDVAWKANRRNVRLLARAARGAPRHRRRLAARHRRLRAAGRRRSRFPWQRRGG